MSDVCLPLEYELLEGRSYMVPPTPAQGLAEHVQEQQCDIAFKTVSSGVSQILF